MKENTITYSLAKEIKLESHQASGSSCQFSGNTEHRETYSIIPQRCHQENAEIYMADSTAKLQGKGRDGKETGRLKST